MSGIPEPRWIHGDPAAFADDPPENYLPNDQRKTLEDLADFLDGELEEVRCQIAAASELPTSLSDAAYEAYEVWKKATKKLADEVSSLWDETVGDDWDEGDDIW